MMERTRIIITRNEILIRIVVILFVVSLIFFSDEEQVLWIKSVGFLSAFFITAYLHKYFFPFTMLAIACFFSASTNELFGYADAEFTQVLWKGGDILLPVGIISFGYRLIFKYKVIDDEI